MCLRERERVEEWEGERERRRGTTSSPARPGWTRGSPARQADTRSVASAGIRGGPQGRGNAGGAWRRGGRQRTGGGRESGREGRRQREHGGRRRRPGDGVLIAEAPRPVGVRGCERPERRPHLRTHGASDSSARPVRAPDPFNGRPQSNPARCSGRGP